MIETNCFRPSAVPLVTVDPFFSIWSLSDKLYDDVTYHWTTKRNPMAAGVYIDGEFYKVMGFRAPDTHRATPRFEQPIKQVALKVTPTRTIYTFRNDIVEVTLTFTTPLLLSRLDILSRPVSYIEYNIEVIDGLQHDIKFFFDISAECSVDGYEDAVEIIRHKHSLACGNATQKVLSKADDTVGIDWGYIHLAHPNAKLYTGIEVEETEDLSKQYKPFIDYPQLGIISEKKNDVIVLAYDDIKSIEYFGKQLNGYYRKFFDDFESMLETSVFEYPEIKNLCISFDEELMAEAEKIDSRYAKIVSLAYRQAIAAHKLVESDKGEILFLSKECQSNGCIGTLDITYPSIPLFLKYNPELVLGMLRPIIKYANSDAWEYEFAPHDVGRYPLANGQVYGIREAKPGQTLLDFQMPIEECGNALLCVAAAVKAKNDFAFARENETILRKWADYLVKMGYDPENQLCTDDFAGHLAHNCNLSIKAILGIAAFGWLFGEEEYINLAKSFAKKWEKEAKNASGGTRLAFDKENTWSLKYNIVWDKLLNLGLFSNEIFEDEIKIYIFKMNEYGIPLDSRSDYTKLDWLCWTTVLTENQEYRGMVFESMMKYINTTPDRTPMTDWYHTLEPRQEMFQNRTVVGGLFINLLNL